jgi:hypothetical protein
MSKTFAQAPKPRPSPEAIAAFERGGAGQDTQTHIPSKVGMGEPTIGQLEQRGGNAVEHESQTHIAPNVGKREPTETNQREPTRRLSIDLPKSWHQRFKTACSGTDRKMLAEVTGFIKSRTVELENEAAELKKSRDE